MDNPFRSMPSPSFQNRVFGYDFPSLNICLHSLVFRPGFSLASADQWTGRREEVIDPSSLNAT